MRLLWFAFVASAAWAAPAFADDGWSKFDNHDGVTFEKRSVPGSRFNEYRAVTSVNRLTPADMAKAVWTAITESLPPTIKKRTIISRKDDEIVVYDQIHTPVVSDRDVTIRIRRVVNGNDIEIRFDTANELGPPPASGYVRLPLVRGKWTLSPDSSGTHVVYECYSEPGGSIPAFLVRGAQQSEVAKDVERVLSRLGNR